MRSIDESTSTANQVGRHLTEITREWSNVSLLDTFASANVQSPQVHAPSYSKKFHDIDNEVRVCVATRITHTHFKASRKLES